MKKAISGAVAATVLLAGCGGKSDANEKNFGAAIGQYLDKKGELCLNIASKWPADVDPMDLRLQTVKARRLAALEAAGLATSEDIEVPAVGFDGKPIGATFKVKVKRYALTDAAKPFERSRELKPLGGGGATETRTDLCWGRKTLDKVVKWEGPMKFGDFQSAKVTYLYRIEGLPDWAKKPELVAAFPQVGQIVEGAGKKEEQHGVKLTSIGWEAEGLDR